MAASSFKPISSDRLRAFIRDVPDFPKPGIVFKDISPLLADPVAFRSSIVLMAEQVSDFHPDRIVAIESRGFVFGAALATLLQIGFVMARKPNKLPAKTTKIEYDLEYGKDALEMHTDGLRRDDRVLIVDDVLATGGTARATAELVELMGGKVAALLFLMELSFLKGRDRLKDYPTFSLMSI